MDINVQGEIRQRFLIEANASNKTHIVCNNTLRNAVIATYCTSPSVNQRCIETTNPIARWGFVFMGRRMQSVPFATN